MKPLKLLVTSVGSLVGQNILDSLEPRRRSVSIVGVDANAENPRLFRCDTAYLVPLVDDGDAFRRRLLEIVEIEEPDLVLTGRDHDAAELVRLSVEHPAIAPLCPYGSSDMSQMMQDKWASWEFARAHGLPFAESVLGGTPVALAQCLDLAERHGLPLIAKPRLGFGSLGVRLLFDTAAIRSAASTAGAVIQPSVGAGSDWSSSSPDGSAGIPLFTTYRDTGQVSCQTVIGPDGTFPPPFCTHNLMVNGKSERIEICLDPAASALTGRYADAVGHAGWRGPFNLQCRQLADGSFIGIEMNGRLTGATSARAWLGHDEIGIIVERFVGPGRLPPHPRLADSVVVRFPTSYPVVREVVRDLQERREWHAPDAGREPDAS